jgi:hypothetical protein
MKTKRLLLALVFVVFATAVQQAGARTTDTKSWCTAVIQVNTEYGTMKNKRFLPPGQVPVSAWKKVIDATLAGQSEYIARTPAEIKTAVKHQVAWFAKVKANHYSLKTSPAPMTIADVQKIAAFEKTKCGITFGS